MLSYALALQNYLPILRETLQITILKNEGAVYVQIGKGSDVELFLDSSGKPCNLYKLRRRDAPTGQ